jgi:hypothetical protein
MTAEQTASIVIAASMRVLAAVEGMKAANMQCQVRGDSMAYGEAEFIKVVQEEGIGYNDVLETLRRGL